MAMIAMTTSSSIKVNPPSQCRFDFELAGSARSGVSIKQDAFWAVLRRVKLCGAILSTRVSELADDIKGKWKSLQTRWCFPTPRGHLAMSRLPPPTEVTSEHF